MYVCSEQTSDVISFYWGHKLNTQACSILLEEPASEAAHRSTRDDSTSTSSCGGAEGRSEEGRDSRGETTAEGGAEEHLGGQQLSSSSCGGPLLPEEALLQPEAETTQDKTENELTQDKTENEDVVQLLQAKPKNAPAKKTYLQSVSWVLPNSVCVNTTSKERVHSEAHRHKHSLSLKLPRLLG